MGTRPEKLFHITVTIFEVPQSKVNDWLTDIANMDYDSSVSIAEVDSVVEETEKKEDPE
jgi:hypothetical protein